MRWHILEVLIVELAAMAMAMATSGTIGCECVNQTDALSSIGRDRPCTTPGGENGTLARGGSCVPFSYGTGCHLHDMLHDPDCQNGLNNGLSNVFGGDFDFPWLAPSPRYCLQAWCFVDRDECKRESFETVFPSDYFPSLYYSYTTCNSTAEDWLDHGGVLGGISLYSAAPGSYQAPNLYKRNENGEILNKVGGEYYDDGVPFEGLYFDYVKELVRISNGDIKNVSYTHASKSSIRLHPSSKYTAAVQDIQNGIVDMAVAPFWVTSERLKMTAFTVPLVYDKTVLVIRAPGPNEGIGYEAAKVMEPFTPGLWLASVGIIAVAAFLSVWFADQDKLAKKRYGRSMHQIRAQKKRGRKRVYLRLALDSFLNKGLFFFSAGVEQDQNASLPQKFLMFGFGFFILISVSAYVANLAAFLTQSGTGSFVGTIEEAVAQRIPICAHPALREELEYRWPRAKFVWSEDEWNGVVDKYDADECELLAVGREDNTLDATLMQKFCDRGLVFTDSLVIETAIAFPVKPELAPGLSYWINQGERYVGVSLRNTIDAYVKETGGPQCSFELHDLDLRESDDYARISTNNMVLPITFFLACAGAGIVLQMVHDRSSRDNGNKARDKRTTLFGRTSQLDLFAGSIQSVQYPEQNRSEKEETNEEGVGHNSKRKNSNMKKSVTFNDSSTDVCWDGLGEEKTEECEESDLNVKTSAMFNGVTGDEINDTFEETTPQSPLKGSIHDFDNDETTASLSDENELNRQIQEMVDTGAIDAVLKCLQEMKRLKKVE